MDVEKYVSHEDEIYQSIKVFEEVSEKLFSKSFSEWAWAKPDLSDFRGAKLRKERGFCWGSAPNPFRKDLAPKKVPAPPKTFDLLRF